MNTGWRLNDMIWFKKCVFCGIEVRWQHEEKEQNTEENFHKTLKNNGWRKWLGMWFCKHHGRR